MIIFSVSSQFAGSRFKSVRYKRSAEMETAVRMPDNEEEMDDFPHFGAGGGSGSGKQVAFRGEVPSPAKRLQRSGNFQPPQQPQVALFLTTEKKDLVKNTALIRFSTLQVLL